jgi:hypothetical protein
MARHGATLDLSKVDFPPFKGPGHRFRLTKIHMFLFCSSMSRSPEQRRSIRLSDVAARGGRLSAWCEQCGHRHLFTAAELARRVPVHASLQQIAGRMRCSVCDGRRVQLRPDYGGLGVVARHDDQGD